MNGCGWQAESQVDAIRSAVPTIERVVAYCRTPEKLRAFCAKTDAEPGESPSDAAAQDVVVTATTSRTRSSAGNGCAREPSSARSAPTMRGRELDNVVSSSDFRCCDSREQAKLEWAD